MDGCCCAFNVMYLTHGFPFASLAMTFNLTCLLSLRRLGCFFKISATILEGSVSVTDGMEGLGGDLTFRLMTFGEGDA